MNVIDILKYGNQTLLNSLEGIDNPDWETGGVCGNWSVREIMIHVTSFELWHGEVLSTFVERGPTPILDEYAELGLAWNDLQVERHKEWSKTQVMDEYNQAHVRLMAVAKKVPAEIFPQNGTLPWYGAEYCLNDFLVYSNYGHKREHSAQINVFKDSLPYLSKES